MHATRKTAMGLEFAGLTLLTAPYVVGGSLTIDPPPRKADNGSRGLSHDSR